MRVCTIMIDAHTVQTDVTLHCDPAGTALVIYKRGEPHPPVAHYNNSRTQRFASNFDRWQKCAIVRFVLETGK